MSADLQSKFADVNGVRLHYVIAGQGKLILFVHGFPEFWAEWENQLIEFGQDYQAVAVDMRGYNLSSTSLKIFARWQSSLGMKPLFWSPTTGVGRRPGRLPRAIRNGCKNLSSSMRPIRLFSQENY
jgi:pimeloyl-ACP methyl ester carboxylesterase